MEIKVEASGAILAGALIESEILLRSEDKKVHATAEWIEQARLILGEENVRLEKNRRSFSN